MNNVSMPAIEAETRYSDIIIPTMDLVRGSFFVHLLMTNSMKVCDIIVFFFKNFTKFKLYKELLSA